MCIFTLWFAHETVMPFLPTLEALCLLCQTLTFGMWLFRSTVETSFLLWPSLFLIIRSWSFVTAVCSGWLLIACFLGVYELPFVVVRLWIPVACNRLGVLWRPDSERFLLPLLASILNLFQCICNRPLWRVVQ